MAVLDEDKQAEFACVGQTSGVTLAQSHGLLDVLIPGKALSVPTLGRRTDEAGKKAGALLPVLDEFTRPLVRDTASDEIYVRAPVLMVVEQESMCWISGHLSATVHGEAWSQEFAALPNLEQVARDNGMGLTKGVALENKRRQEQQRERLVDQSDHFHGLQNGGVGVRKAQTRAQQALAKAEVAQEAADERGRRGESQQAEATRAHHAWKKAELRERVPNQAGPQWWLATREREA